MPEDALLCLQLIGCFLHTLKALIVGIKSPKSSPQITVKMLLLCLEPVMTPFPLVETQPRSFSLGL